MEDDRADLYSAIVKLKTSIDELNQKGRERLLDAFTKVNRKFNEVYTKLFNGGTAKIELVDSDDPLKLVWKCMFRLQVKDYNQSHCYLEENKL